MAREELKWQNIDADDLPAAVKKSFDAMVEAEATFKADLETQFADALRIVLVNRLCEHNSQLISKLLFARQPA
jgi:hypothetical protein